MQINNLATGLAAALFASSVHAGAAEFNAKYNGDSSRALVVNNCPYTVYLWSVLGKEDYGTPFELQTGAKYQENFRSDDSNPDVGVSIKLSKTNTCQGVPITQLEYFQKHADNTTFLDVSYVDCRKSLFPDEDCPGRKDGYYLKSGNADVATTADSSNTQCPTFSCTDLTSCDKTSYVEPDDVQTKACKLGQPLDFYLCGLDGGSPLEAGSSSQQQTPSPSATSAAAEVKVAAAEVTPAPVEQPKTHNVWTEVVYVTKYETVNVNAKRHPHGHAHRHFRA